MSPEPDAGRSASDSEAHLANEPRLVRLRSLRELWRDESSERASRESEGEALRLIFGGADGTRTRDLWRDRPAF